MLELNSSKWKTKTTIDVTKKNPKCLSTSCGEKTRGHICQASLQRKKNQLATNSNKILL